MKASDLIVQCLENEQVRYVFGLPGEEILDILDSFLDSRITFIPTRHEQGAAFMADAYGRLTGRPGVCLSTLGPGATNLATGVADANLDRAPLVAITGQAGRDRIHKESHQRVDIVEHFIEFRREVVRRRTEFELRKAEARAHILEGLKIALDHLDAVIKTIRESPDVEQAKANLMKGFDLSELQAQAILDMRLARLAALERKKIEDEYLAIIQLIAELEDILANPARVLQIIKDELVELKKKYAGERKTRVADDSSREMTDEDLIADEDVVVTISGRGYIKRQPVATYRRQHRGGKGIIGHVTREEDAVEHLIVANTHDWALFFTNRGRVFSAKVHSIVDASRQAKGTPIINLPGVQVEAGEVPMATIVLKDFTAGSYLVLATRRGKIKKTPLEQFERVRSTGIRAITIDEKDELAWVDVSTGDDDVIIATSQGKIARFHETDVRAMGRDAAGVIGIRLARVGDFVVSMSVVQPDADLLVLTETGYGKRVSLSEFRPMHRGSQGVRLISLEGKKTGDVAAVQQVTEEDEELLLISAGGQVVRTDVTTINRQHAQARGVITMRMNEGDRVVAISAFRAGLADRDGIGDNDSPEPGGVGPDAGGGA
jgi:DNA gyrase subunit A